MDWDYLALSVVTGTSTYLVKQLADYIGTLQQKKISDIDVKDDELKIGYQREGRYNYPIKISMQKSPHVLICGLSQQGKSKMAEYILRDKQCIILNAYDDDYASLRPLARFSKIDDIDNILNYLCVNMDGNDTPIYVLIDEILALSFANKDISKRITILLSQSAHNKIYLICITQSPEKDVIKYKQLFNTRICFKMIDDVQYKTCLGVMPTDIMLRSREFYYFDGVTLGKGSTYDI